MIESCRRLLAISWELPPLAGPRAIQVARTLEGLTWHQWQATAVTLAPRRGGPALRDGGGAPELVVDGVRIAPVPSAEEGFWWRAVCRLYPAAAARPDRSRPWIAAASHRALEELDRAPHDVIVSFAQPWSDHLVGLRVAKQSRLPWVAHFSDPWVDSPFEPRMSAAHRRWREGAERAVIEAARAVIFVTAETLDLVMRKYPQEWSRKARVVPHAFDARTGFPSHPASSTRSGKMQIVHTGRFYRGKRTPLPLFAALAQLRADRRIRDQIEVVLVGPDAAEYLHDARAAGIEDLLRVIPRVPPADAARHAAAADVLLIFDAVVAPPNPFLPSKLIEYLRFRRPLLGITDPGGASGKLLREVGASAVDPSDVRQLADEILRLLRAWQSDTLNVAPQFDLVAQRYEMRQTAAAFAAVLNDCVGTAN